MVKAGDTPFDVVIAFLMPCVSSVRWALGPRGLMPNPAGTVTPDVATAVQCQGWPVQFRVDKAGIVHSTIGRRSFEPTSCRVTRGLVLHRKRPNLLPARACI